MSESTEERHAEEVVWDITLNNGQIVQYKGHVCRERNGQLEFCDLNGNVREAVTLASVRDYQLYRASGE